VAAAAQVDGDTIVTFGHPGPQVVNFWNAVGMTRVEVTQDPATLSTNRSREETLRQTVIVSCWRPGGHEVEAVASDAAYTLLEGLERYCRVTDPTLGGVVRHCFLASHSSEGETDPAALVDGRTIEIEAVFEARVRITG
jgi:hypothetical protein